MPWCTVVTAKRKRDAFILKAQIWHNFQHCEIFLIYKNNYIIKLIQ